MRERHERLPALEVCGTVVEGIRPVTIHDPFLIDISIIRFLRFGFCRLAVAGGAAPAPLRHPDFSFLLAG